MEDISIISELHQCYKLAANKAPDLSLQELADLYLDTNDQDVKDSCFGYFMMRYWGMVSNWQFNSESLGLSDECFADWLVDTLLYVLGQHKWREEGHALYGDPNAFDKAVHAVAGTKRAMEYQYANMDKRKANAVWDSVEDQITEVGDGALEDAGLYEDINPINGAEVLINEYVKRNQLIEALLLYNAMTPAAFKTVAISKKYQGEDNRGRETVKSVKEEHEAFDPRKCMQLMRAMNLDEISTFCKHFKVKDAQGLFNELQNTPNTKLYRHWDKICIEIANDKQYLACLQK